MSVSYCREQPTGRNNAPCPSLNNSFVLSPPVLRHLKTQQSRGHCPTVATIEQKHGGHNWCDLLTVNLCQHLRLLIKSWNDCTSLHKAISGNEQQMRFKWQHSARLPDRTHHQHRDYGTACLSAATVVISTSVAGRCSNRHVGGDLLLPVCHLERPSALHQKIRSIHSNFHYDCHVLSGGNLPESGQAYPLSAIWKIWQPPDNGN